MDFKRQVLCDRLAGKRTGNYIHFFHEVDSTNDALVKLAHTGVPEGAVAIAECQTKGKGRLNRRWQSPPGRNIYASRVVRPAMPLWLKSNSVVDRPGKEGSGVHGSCSFGV